MEERIEIQVPSGMPKVRLEEFLFDEFPNLSRMYLRRIVRDEKCEVNGRFENVGYRLRGGDFLEVELDKGRENSMRPENVPLDIVYEDEHVVVVNKPPGMLVHPTNRDKNGTLLNALVFHLNYPNADGDASLHDNSLTVRHHPSERAAFIRPGLVHRLDKETSGLIVIAKSVRCHRSLARQFQRKYVEKKYLAVVDGTVGKDEGTIDVPVGRIADEKRWDLKHDGKHSETRFRVIERRGDRTLLELEPVTGRTNQLRIHCASIGHPIVGDISRGGSEFGRLCLHAFRLSFIHPVTRENVSLTSPIEFHTEK